MCLWLGIWTTDLVDASSISVEEDLHALVHQLLGLLLGQLLASSVRASLGFECFS